MTQDTNTQGQVPEALRRSTAADGKTELFNLPGYPLMVRAVDFNRIHTESEMLKHALWIASSFTVHRYLMSNAEGRWSGAEKAACHDELCCLYVAVFRGVEVDRVRVDLEADWMAVHDATQELTDHMDVVIGFPLKGVPDYEALAPKFFAYFHRLAAHAIRASHGQAPAGAAEEIDKALNVYAQAFAARVNGWTRQNGDDLPGARSALFAAIHAYAQASTRPTTSPQADSVQ